MKKHSEIHLTFKVPLAPQVELHDRAAGIVQHLAETYNYDGSLPEPTVAVSVLSFDPYVQVDYIVATGGSGSTRMRLNAVPAWLTFEPGRLIHKISEI